jgi:hypothetical protein
MHTHTRVHTHVRILQQRFGLSAEFRLRLTLRNGATAEFGDLLYRSVYLKEKSLFAVSVASCVKEPRAI